MSEHKAFRDSMIKLAILCAFAICYSMGGWGDFFGGQKWIRRFMAPFILCGGCYWFSRDWRYFVQFPVMCISLSLGYGESSSLMKFFTKLFGL